MRAFETTADQPSNLESGVNGSGIGAPRLASIVLDIVPRSRAESTSSREQMETSGAQ